MVRGFSFDNKRLANSDHFTCARRENEIQSAFLFSQQKIIAKTLNREQKRQMESPAKPIKNSMPIHKKFVTATLE